MTLIQQPLYLQKKAYPARADRQLMGNIFSSGVYSQYDLKVSASTAARGVLVDVGAVYIVGTQSPPSQGTYRAYSDTAITLAIDPATTYPRLDQIIARVYDSVESGSLDQATIEVLKGVEASGATLNNRNGAVANLPVNSIRLADVLAPVGSGTFVSTGYIRDRRRLASHTAGGIVPIGTQISYAGSTLPTEGGWWDWADGGLVDRVMFDTFFARVQHAYNGGVDPGNLMVRKPDKRGRGSVGANNFGLTGASGRMNSHANTRGSNGGEELHTLTGSESGQNANAAMSSAGIHSHGGSTGQYQVSGANIVPLVDGGNVWTQTYVPHDTVADFNPIAATHPYPAMSYIALDHSHSISSDGNHFHYLSSRAADLAHENMAPYEVDNWIVRLA